MKQVTKKQHYVPETYLKSWCNEQGKLAVYDKTTERRTSPAPRGTLYERYYYEDPQSDPTNELENRFGPYETAFGTTIKFLSFVIDSAQSNRQSPSAALEDGLKNLSRHTDALKQFAGVAYFRTPAALTAMREQLAAEDSEQATRALEHLRSPYALNTDGFASTFLDRFGQLSILLGYSKSERLHTGDWPCYPLGGGEQHANFGFDIGNHPAAFAGMAISPRIYMLLLPILQNRPPLVLAREIGPDVVRQANEMVATVSQHRVIV